MSKRQSRSRRSRPASAPPVSVAASPIDSTCETLSPSSVPPAQGPMDELAALDAGWDDLADLR